VRTLGVVVNLEKNRINKPSLESLTTLVRDDLSDVNKVIALRMDSPVNLITELARHIVAAGGKRLRPMLTLASAKLCNYSTDKRYVPLAACVEFIHTATLLHDDVVDDSSLRRGLSSANAIFGNKASVLVGDFLFSRSFQLMVEDGSLKVLQILSHASSVIAEGEVLQLMTANNTETSEQAYLDVVRSKTAELFAAACRIGAVLAKRPRVEEEALEAFGMNLGLTFQIIDDVLDYSAKTSDFGKHTGTDFRDGKITLPIILAYRRGTDKERSFWRRTLEKQNILDGDFERGYKLLVKHGAIDDSIKRARHFGAVARDALGIFPDSPAKRALIETIDFSMERVH